MDRGWQKWIQKLPNGKTYALSLLTVSEEENLKMD